MEYKCSGCQKIVKSSSGLKRHQTTCSEYQESLDVPEIKDAFNEDTETINDVEHKSRLGKLRDAYKSGFDAEYRAKIQAEYKTLGGNPLDLLK